MNIEDTTPEEEPTPEELFLMSLASMEEQVSKLIAYARQTQANCARNNLAGGRELALVITQFQQGGHWLTETIHEVSVAMANATKPEVSHSEYDRKLIQDWAASVNQRIQSMGQE